MDSNTPTPPSEYEAKRKQQNREAQRRYRASRPFPRATIPGDRVIMELALSERNTGNRRKDGFDQAQQPEQRLRSTAFGQSSPQPILTNHHRVTPGLSVAEVEYHGLGRPPTASLMESRVPSATRGYDIANVLTMLFRRLVSSTAFSTAMGTLAALATTSASSRFREPI